MICHRSAVVRLSPLSRIRDGRTPTGINVELQVLPQSHRDALRNRDIDTRPRGPAPTVARQPASLEHTACALDARRRLGARGSPELTRAATTGAWLTGSLVHLALIVAAALTFRPRRKLGH